MRRGRRTREAKSNFRYLIYLSMGTLLVVILTFVITFVIYNNKLKNSTYSMLSTEKIADLVPNTDIGENSTKQASTDMGKTIEEAIKEAETNIVETREQTNTTQSEETSVNTEVKTVIEVKDPEFIKPVEGDIIREFAKDTLIYSDTLQEWVTHLGVDIRAERTSVVNAAEAGTVIAIKSDPRYGLTVVIDHVNGYKSIYSNLLTSEFVTEGENVEKGQSLGTVGNSASFEIADEPHLHFEILKDNINIDPKIYF